MSTSLFDQLQASLRSTYTLDRELGGGGMSRVFVADETRLGRKVVIKLMSSDVAAGISADRFEREIKLAASLQQANIVPVLSAGDVSGVPYYTMPFVEGESLRSRLAKSGALPIGEVIGILRDVARALAYAHAHGVVHRDIKPDNVLISGGTAVVTDFGIAKALAAAKIGRDRDEAPGTALTQMGTSIGTPAYMAPEQAAADPAVDHRADLYSFGCMAYELITGHTPFHGRSPQRLLAAHMVEAPKPVADIRPDTPPVLADLVMRCLEKEPAARPASANDVVLALESVTSSGMVDAMPPILLGGREPLMRALVLYAIAFLMVAVLTRAAIVGIGLPDWVFPGAMIVMLLGLPVILLTAYVHRVTRRAVTQTPALTPGGHPLPQGTMATLALKASPHVTWRRTMLGGAYALAVFAVLVGGWMVLRMMGIGPAGSLLASGKIGAQDRLIVTDFRSADSSLAHVLAEAVRTTLGESRVVSIMPPTAIAAALQRMQRPTTSRIDVALARELAQREGAKAIVDGDVTAIAGGAGGYVLSIRLVAADSGNERAAFRESVKDPAELLDAVDKIARKLRGRIGESLKTVRSAAPIEQVTTGSFEALRKYAEGVRAMDLEGNPIKAAGILREAVRIDTTFAMAYRKLGVALNNTGRPRVEVDSALERAYRFRDRLTDRERNIAVGTYYHLGPGRDREKAIAAYQAAMEFDPNETGAANNLATIYSGRRQFAAAESLYRRAIIAGRATSQNYTNLTISLFNQGKLAESEQMADEVRRRFPATTQATTSRTSFLYARGQLDSMEAHLKQMTTSPNPIIKINGVSGLGNYSLLRGRLKDLKRYAEEATAQSRAFGMILNPLADSLQYSFLDLYVFEDTARALRRVETTLARTNVTTLPFSNRPYLGLATFFAMVGKPDRARAMLARFDAEMPDSLTRRASIPSRNGVLGSIELAQRRYPEAIRLFWRADTTYDGPDGACSFCVYPAVARAYDMGGAPDSAIKYYEGYMKGVMMGRENMDGLNRPMILRRLGELYEQKGDTGRAGERYLNFVELWKNADPELQPKVADIRRRLTRLGDIERR